MSKVNCFKSPIKTRKDLKEVYYYVNKVMYLHNLMFAYLPT